VEGGSCILVTKDDNSSCLFVINEEIVDVDCCKSQRHVQVSFIDEGAIEKKKICYYLPSKVLVADCRIWLYSDMVYF
jgi:hypothetical protein